MRDTKKQMVMYSFYDRTGIAQFLEEQAKKGWLLEKITSFGWKFRRIEPKNISYAVTYFAKASAFDPEPSEAQLTFRDFCEHTGWKLAASSAQMQIFYNEDAAPVPIETDAVVEVDSIHAAAKKGYLASYYLLLGAAILQIALFFYRLATDFVGTLSSNANLFTGFCWGAMLFLILVEICGYFRWYRRAKALAEENGSFLETRSHKNVQLIVLMIMLIAFAALMVSYGSGGKMVIAVASVVLVVATTGVAVLLSELLKRLKVSAGVNKTVTLIAIVAASIVMTAVLVRMIMSNLDYYREEHTAETYDFRGHTFRIYKDELPLRIEDLMEVAYDGYSYECTGEGSLLLSEYTAIQRPRMDGLEHPGLKYQAVAVKAPMLYERCKDELLDDFAHNYGHPVPEDENWRSHVEVDASHWGAREAYQLKLGETLQERYLLCYEDRIVEIDFDWEVTPEQMQIVGEKLDF